MNAPRGTKFLAGTSPNHKLVKIRPVFLTRFERDALACEVKDTLRFPITAANSLVHPGSFECLDMESGRVRWRPKAEVRARCRFASGEVRAVTVRPAFNFGDLFWVKGGGAAGKRALSQWTLEVVGIMAGRLQDMSDKDALRAGAALMPCKGENLTPRDWFAAAWDARFVRGSWQCNPWVWIVYCRRHRRNIDEFLKDWAPPTAVSP